MTEEEKIQLRLALAILSGREDVKYLSIRKAKTLDVGIADIDLHNHHSDNLVIQVQKRAEEIVFDWITKAVENSNPHHYETDKFRGG
jgi:hypothetical protein